MNPSNTHGVQRMATSTALAPIDTNRDTRWSQENLQRCRTRRHTDATIARHVSILEQVARAHDGVLPPYKWLNEHGYFSSYEVMRQYPQSFAHIKTSTDKKFEVYAARETAKAEHAAQILPPSNVKTLAEYNVPGAQFNPTHLAIEPGTAEQDWMQIGRALASVAQSAYWWVGDWLVYGFKTYGIQATFDLAQQATGYSRTQLHECSYMAKRFPPERRCGALTFFHHRCVASCPPAMADKLLAEAADLGLTGRQIKELGDTQMGKPERKTKSHALQVKLPGAVYDALRERANGHDLNFFVANIVGEWLDGRLWSAPPGRGK
jgi:hypothetical protein